MVDSTPADTAAPDTEAPDTVPGEPGFTFGYVRPPTGLVSQLATAQETAIGLAITDINDAGGVNGAPAALVTVDESLDGDAAAAVEELLAQGADMILGPVSSTGAKAVLTTLDTAGSVACSASATAPELTSLDTENVLYRTAMPDTYTVSYVADQIAADVAAAGLPEGQPYKVSIIARQDDYGVGVGNGLAARARCAGDGCPGRALQPTPGDLLGGGRAGRCFGAELGRARLVRRRRPIGRCARRVRRAGRDAARTGRPVQPAPRRACLPRRPDADRRDACHRCHR